MSEYVVQRGCMGLTMEDGTRYNADRRGHIKVDRPEHAAAIERNAHASGGHIHTATHLLAPEVSSTRCEPCRFTGWPWQKTCPRCDAEMKRVA